MVIHEPTEDESATVVITAYLKRAKEAKAMKGIVVVTSEGPRGPAYIRFSREPVASTEPTKAQDEVVVDYDAAGGVVGVELVSLGPEMFAALADVARKHDLDLSALLARPFAVPPQAA